MGRVFISQEEAASALEINLETLRTYVSRGYLRRNPRNEEEVVKSDVDQLLQEREVLSSLPFNKTSFAILESRVRFLESQLMQVFSLLELAKHPIRVKDEEAMDLYDLAKAVVSGEVEVEEKIWADILPRVDIPFLTQVSQVASVDNPWLPFYRVAEILAFAPHTGGLRIKLRKGLHQMKTMAGIWLESRGRMPKTAEYLDDDEQAVVSSIHALLNKTRH